MNAWVSFIMGLVAGLAIGIGLVRYAGPRKTKRTVYESTIVKS